MYNLVSYVLLGLSLSAPIGPINAAQLDKGMKYGFVTAWMVGLGAMSADGLYMILIYIGFSKLLKLPGVEIVLWAAGSIILMYLGIESLRNVRKIDLTVSRERESNLVSFGTGFLMAVSNPMNFVFWFGIYGSVLAHSLHEEGSAQFLGNSFGIFIGILLWDVTMALIASMFQQFASRRVLQTASALAGLSLVGFAGYFALQVKQSIF